MILSSLILTNKKVENAFESKRIHKAKKYVRMIINLLLLIIKTITFLITKLALDRKFIAYFLAMETNLYIYVKG